MNKIPVLFSLTCGGAVYSTFRLVHGKRDYCRYIADINDMADGYEELRQQNQRVISIGYNNQERMKDEKWRASELAKQEQWMNGPIYKKVLSRPPFPDY